MPRHTDPISPSSKSQLRYFLKFHSIFFIPSLDSLLCPWSPSFLHAHTWAYGVSEFSSILSLLFPLPGLFSRSNIIKGHAPVLSMHMIQCMMRYVNSRLGSDFLSVRCRPRPSVCGFCGHPFMTSTEFWDRLNPSPLFVCKIDTVVCLSPNLVHLLTPPPPSLRTSYMEPPCLGQAVSHGLFSCHCEDHTNEEEEEEKGIAFFGLFGDCGASVYLSRCYDDDEEEEDARV